MNLKNKSILVTGGAGFIGSRLVIRLVEKGYFVKVLDNLSRGSIDQILPLIKSGQIEFINGDIRHKDVVDNAMEGIDYVFHEAATNINRSIKYPGESFDINFNGSYVVFKSAKEHNIKKILFASSASVYGQPDILPMREDSKLNPITPYCICKLSSEYLLRCFDLKSIIFRYFNVYGSGQHVDAYYTSVINAFQKNLLRGDPPIIIGNGDQYMDFIHVSDIVNANILGLESNVENEIFNVGSGVSTTVKELAYKLIKLMGKEVDPIFSPRKVIVDTRRADIQKIHKFLSFAPKITLEDGLREIVLKGEK